MPPVQVLIDPSQFPDRVREDLHRGLVSRRIASKFHYDSYKQTRAWLSLHEALSPARRDPACLGIYEEAARHIAERLSSAHVIGLGCGGGQKDLFLLRHLREAARAVRYAPVDVSVSMTLVAAEAARGLGVPSFPAVCDFETVQDLESLVRCDERLPRAITFYGMLPNVDAKLALPQLAALLGEGDTLLVSANLAPGADYQAGLRKVLAQYDNPLTTDWLTLFLRDLGFERDDGTVRWTIEPAAPGASVHGFVAWFELRRERAVGVEGRIYEFKSGERIRLFASWRHTPELVAAELATLGVRVERHWIASSGEEGVFEARG